MAQKSGLAKAGTSVYNARVTAPKHPPMCDFAERPFILFWEVTRACALACKHCRAIAQPKAHPEELNHEEALALVDEIAELAPPMLVLTGGDPMMRRDIFDIIERATARGLRVALSPAATNRLLHTDFHKLRAAGVVSMSLSLDGATQETHDTFRGVPHTFERTLQAARMAKEAGIQLQINTTISRSTLPELEGFVDILKEIQPDVWSVFLLVPTGRATLEELPGATELEALWSRLLELRSELPFAIKTTEGHHYRRALMQAARSSGAPAPRHMVSTRDGKGVAFISHVGEIQPSGFLPLTAGNVRTDKLADIYRSHPLFVQLRNDDALGGKCGRCEYRRMCGGSRARAYGSCGDMMAAEPLCNYIPAALRGDSPQS
ncbi:MAG: TIGR04053 family radical SAM/SPASM domain-containing protein [Akkermansia sp.]|nr:TIGR04053 family radical SAM/SPASM domain-containing protein [Akkermansia sp.]